MSWSIPYQIEQDIICGKAKYQTYQVGFGGQNILPVPTNAYVVIFGYDFSPAGGGVGHVIPTPATFDDLTLFPDIIRWFETQQISFYTGSDFFPFIHHVDLDVKSITNNEVPNENFCCITVDNSPIARQVYITSDNDVTISVGLVLTGERDTSIAIPITSRTPFNLTYGGSGQLQNEFTDLGGAPNIRFVQPTQKDPDDFGVIGADVAENQTFWGPDVNNGVYDPTAYLDTFGAGFVNAAAANYFLCLHYAIYHSTVPETRG